MQRLSLLCCLAFAAGCGRPADRAAEDTAAMDTAATATAAPAATISLSDVAGTWKLTSRDKSGGTPVETRLVAKADTSGWTMTGPDGRTVPLRIVAVEGDSVVTEMGPYESFIRKGVKVTTRTVQRLQGDKLVGTIEARYATKSGDSVVMRTSEGTRMP